MDLDIGYMIRKLPGKPDIVLKKYKTVVFVHGCFWHGHEHCRYYVIPKTNTEKWQNKILGNQRNDELSKQVLIRGRLDHYFNLRTNELKKG